MSAVLKSITPAANLLGPAVEAYIAAKRDEDAAKKRRVEAEERILKLQSAKEEGAITVEAGGYKLTLTGKLSYSIDDLEALRNITAKWDANLVPIKTTYAADETGLKYLRRERPELWQQIARVVTIKPAKTSVAVKV